MDFGNQLIVFPGSVFRSESTDRGQRELEARKEAIKSHDPRRGM